MNQSKFKFGDLVKDKTTGNKFFVFAIASSSPGQFAYRDEYYKSLFLHENDLELYQEPQKKKLYAFWTELKVFHDHDFGIQVISFHPDYEYCKNSPHMNYAPEYDIEYPTKE